MSDYNDYAMSDGDLIKAVTISRCSGGEIYCPDCDECVEPYDGGEQYDCAMSVCPNCGYDFENPGEDYE